MSDLVQLTKDNDIAIITINNPPVNALSPGVPEGIGEAIEQIDKDSGVKAAVLIGGATPRSPTGRRRLRLGRKPSTEISAHARRRRFRC